MKVICVEGSTKNVQGRSRVCMLSLQDLSKDQPSWVITMCIKNISTDVIIISDSEPTLHSKPCDTLQPLPVRLESLQLLATLAKKYFALVRHHLRLMCEVVQRCLQDSDPSVQLHGSKVRRISCQNNFRAIL